MEDENNSGGPLQVFIRLLNGETLSLQFPSRPVLAASVKQRIYETTKIPVNLQRLICGHQLKDNSVISHSNTTLNLSLRLLGGKGGIVSLLRGAATKAGQNKSSCFEAWRVMSRRSLRYINAERKPEELKEKVKDPWKLGEDMIQAILRSKADKKVVNKYRYGLTRRKIEARVLKSDKETEKVMKMLKIIDGNSFAAENYPSLRYVNADRKPEELKERVKEDCWRIGTDLIEAKIGRKGVSDSAEAGLQKSEKEACWNGKRKMIPGGEVRLLRDNHIFTYLVKSCANSGTIKQDGRVHSRSVVPPSCGDDDVKLSLVDICVKLGLPDISHRANVSTRLKNSVFCTSMIFISARDGRKKEAMELFSWLPIKTLFSWTVLISGFAQGGNGVEAFVSFIEMRRSGVRMVDAFVLSNIVGSAANLAVLGLGRQVHGLVIASGYESCLLVSNALVDMYAKCSDILAAKQVFGRISPRDVVSWTSIIDATAQHGRAEEALALYDDMLSAGIKPNEVTFVRLIYACSQSKNLVYQGRTIFKSMEDYGIRLSVLAALRMFVGSSWSVGVP